MSPIPSSPLGATADTTVVSPASSSTSSSSAASGYHHHHHRRPLLPPRHPLSSAMDSDDEVLPHGRPSLLHYRPTLGLRSHHHHNGAKPPPHHPPPPPPTTSLVAAARASLQYDAPPPRRRKRGLDPHGPGPHHEARATVAGPIDITSDDDDDSFGDNNQPRRRHHPNGDHEELGDDDDDERKVNEDHDDGDGDDEEDDMVIMRRSSAPPSLEIPLLESRESTPEQEMDVIFCDPTRLPRTTIIDEDGFPIDPEERQFRATLAAATAGLAYSPSGSSTASSMTGTHPGASRRSFLHRGLTGGPASGVRGGNTNADGAVIKSGLLFKQGFGFLNGGWKVRFVVLSSTKMTFYKEERGRQRGAIDLAACTSKSIEIMPRDSVFDGAQATMWRFAIKTKGRRILLSAYTEADMKEWLRCLHVALAVQSAGAGRFTDLVVPNGTLLAGKTDGLMRSSGFVQ